MGGTYIYDIVDICTLLVYKKANKTNFSNNLTNLFHTLVHGRELASDPPPCLLSFFPTYSTQS